MGGGGQQKTEPTPANVPDELKPLFKASTAGTIATQEALPLTSFTGAAPMQVPGMTGQEGTVTGAMQAYPFSAQFTDPFDVSLRTGQDLISKLSGPGAFDIMPFLAGPGDGSFEGLAKNFEDVIAPMVKQSVALSGPVDSGAMDWALAQAAETAALPLVQQSKGIEAAFGQQFNQILSSLGEQATAVKAGLVPALAGLGGTRAGATLQALAEAETGAALPRDIATKQAQQDYQDFLRRFNLASEATLGPTQTLLPSVLTPGSSTTSSK